MQPQVTDEQLKSLKHFSFYLQSYGAETATKEYYIESCSLDWEDEQFHSPQTNISIETYAKIDEVLTEIIETNELFENATTDCDLRGQLEIEIDCIERVLTATASQWEFESNGFDFSKTLEEISEDYSEETYNEVLRIFEQIGENGDGEARFNGGGDSGSLDGDMYINGSSEDMPKLVSMYRNMLFEGRQPSEGLFLEYHFYRQNCILLLVVCNFQVRCIPKQSTFRQFRNLY